MQVWKEKNKLLVTRFLSDTKLDTLSISIGGLVGLSSSFWGVNHKYLGTFLGLLSVLVFGSVYKWFNYFSVVGYNYNVRASGGRRLLSIYIGLVYRVFIQVPAGVQFLVGKRKVFIVADDLVMLAIMGEFIRNLRNLLPYGDRGIIYRNEKSKFKAVKKK